jgi:toxin HigB-1
MIKSFGNKETEQIWNRKRVKKWPNVVNETGYRKLLILDAVENLSDLNVPPGNHLKKLKGTSFHSIRINDQWRIVFKWSHGHATQVEITDYH